MKKKKQPSLKLMRADFKKKANFLKFSELVLSLLFFCELILFSFASGRILAYKKIALFEIKLLLIVIPILIFSRFFSRKIERKTVELEELEQMIRLNKTNYKKKGRWSMNLRTVNSNNYPMDFLQDLVEAKRIDVWLSNILRGATHYNPLKLVLNLNKSREVLIEHSMFQPEANDYVDRLLEKNDVRMNLPNDEIDIFIDMEKRFITITIE